MWCVCLFVCVLVHGTRVRLLGAELVRAPESVGAVQESEKKGKGAAFVDE